MILHKDDAHKSTEIPLQFHSIVDNQSMDVKALLWLKKTAAALHAFSSHGSGARSGSRLALLIGGGNTWIWLLGCDIRSVWRRTAFVAGQQQSSYNFCNILLWLVERTLWAGESDR